MQEKVESAAHSAQSWDMIRASVVGRPLGPRVLADAKAQTLSMLTALLSRTWGARFADALRVESVASIDHYIDLHVAFEGLPQEPLPDPYMGLYWFLPDIREPLRFVEGAEPLPILRVFVPHYTEDRTQELIEADHALFRDLALHYREKYGILTDGFVRVLAQGIPD